MLLFHFLLHDWSYYIKSEFTKCEKGCGYIKSRLSVKYQLKSAQSLDYVIQLYHFICNLTSRKHSSIGSKW